MLRVALSDAFTVWRLGVLDAVSLHRCLVFFVKSELVRVRTVQCFILNGVIFLGSIILWNNVVAPALSFLLRLSADGDESSTAEFIVDLFAVLYKVLWIYPIYCVSFILNTVMYQDVANRALVLCKQQDHPRQVAFMKRLIDEIFRVLLNLVYIIEMNLLYYVPFVGPPIYFVHSCWLASMYCFEYRWVHLRWSSNARLHYFEQNWLYFAGFGFPVSVLSFMCPRFIDTGVFALLFPLCILTSAPAQPQELKEAPKIIRRLPIFSVVQTCSCFVLRLVEGRLSSHQPSDISN